MIISYVLVDWRALLKQVLYLITDVLTPWCIQTVRVCVCVCTSVCVWVCVIIVN